jgi:hypothetical protein
MEHASKSDKQSGSPQPSKEASKDAASMDLKIFGQQVVEHVLANLNRPETDTSETPQQIKAPTPASK